TPESTPEITMDAWSATGTAHYEGSLTPQTPTATATETPTQTETIAATYTPVITNTPDAWQSTGTAIFILTASTTPTQTFTPAPPPTYTRVPPRPPTNNTNRPVYTAPTAIPPAPQPPQ